MLKLELTDPIFEAKQAAIIDTHYWMGGIQEVLDRHGPENETRAQQAADFIAAEYLGDVPPLVQAVADIARCTAQEAADHIAAMKAKCEALRLEMEDGYLNAIRILQCVEEDDLLPYLIPPQAVYAKRLKVNANYY